MTPNQYTPEEPISSIATALAPAALGIVRVSGKGCIELVSKVFSRPKALLEAAGNTLVYGWIQAPVVECPQSGCIETTKIDEVMLAVYRAPKSFTGEDMVEIFCHGGPAVVMAVQNLMLKSGFRQANRGEYTFRAFINGKTDLTKAEAVKEIIDSHTDVSRSHAAGRLAGGLFEEIDSIKKLIIDTLAAIEVEIEYPEDEETIADSFDRSDIELAASRLQALVDSWRGEKLYQDGARVVLAGRTNAGKSSLFNAILKEERAIVSDIEGTTRDWLESWASINGIPVRLFDTAGLRQTSDVIEAQGVEISRSLVHDADVVLYLVDGTQGMNEEDQQFIDNCKEPLIVVYTKSDKGGVLGDKQLCCDPLGEGVASNEVRARGRLSPPACKISSKTGAGLSDLFAKIYGLLTADLGGSGAGSTTERAQAGLGSARQKEAVSEALECVRHALVSADDNYSLDAVVQDLEDALDSLGEVTGDVTPDDVLGSIFANFCVGK
ncbi:tRNA uridine-5-carboxymethylaminomethyl(34) synthesis GTPase MnmE [Treponema bryantii]|uniref:tRNA uridine-5-carboxymethylaminomethyl(34) synthesis GTPase MnmE n=1 Tax=Treponema bryantii TaxID=163 RepID=UPI0003B3DC44|nr:tRNA uridine-5-carboxymethylaminomethyl(34) synthesis GTPase MnmE [Treponema bryantii]